MTLFQLGDRSPTLPDEGRYWVADTASVIGDVTLAEDVSIWFGAILRGDNEPITVGARSNIQDLALLHTDPNYPLKIGQGCTIGHRAIIHGCTIGNNSLIGMGTTIMNGAVIGENCLIGANALIAENKKFSDNSLILGMPGKMVRKLDEKSILALKASADNYVENWRRFKRDFQVKI